jgi:nickel-dependent lactate racemase
MRVELAYGNERASIIIPAGVAADYVTPREFTGFDELSDAVAGAFSKPVDASPLSEAVVGRRSSDGHILIVISDLTRSGGTKEILPAIIRYLESNDIARARIRVLVARGTHRKLTKEEKQYFKTDALRGVLVEEHDCDDASKMSALLLTRRGTPVRVNRMLKDAALVLLVSPVSFHYFAGFGGGRKLVLPGSADRAAIMANHRLSLLDSDPCRLHPECRPGNVQANPVSEDMEEALAALSNVYALNFFGDTEGRTVFINAGDPVQSHQQACEVYRNGHRVPVEKRYDIVILGCGGHPYDINLLQAHKALKHAADIMEPGGTILFYSQCSEGVGSESLANALAAPKDNFFDKAYKEYDLNNQTAISLLTLTERYHVVMVTELEDATLEGAEIERCTNAEACLAEALDVYSVDRAAVIPYGSQTLPFVKKG